MNAPDDATAFAFANAAAAARILAIVTEDALSACRDAAALRTASLISVSEAASAFRAVKAAFAAFESAFEATNGEAK